MVADLPERNGNGSGYFTKILIGIVSAAWGVIVLAGAGWIGSIQSQVNTNAINFATLSVATAKIEVKVDVLARENADLRIKIEGLERALSASGTTNGRRF